MNPDTRAVSTRELPAGTPVIDADPFAEDVLAAPYKLHAEMREAGPLVWLSKYGIWASARHRECADVLKDYETFCSSAGVGLANFKTEPPFRPPSLVLETDPPEHTRARTALARALSQKAVTALQSEFEAQADQLIDRLLQQRDIDGVADIAIAYPLKVFPDAVGLNEEGRENLLAYGNLVFNVFGPDNRLRREALAISAEVGEWIMRHCERGALSLGGIGDDLYQAADQGLITAEEAGLLVRSLLTAGIDTTVGGIGNALYCFAQHPEQWDLLRRDPGQAKHAFEEVLRFEAPVQTFFRTSAKATELAGTAIAENEKILLFLGAGNRDPRRWPDADQFDITRRPSGHLAFGTGIHRCVGQRVAQMEGEIILRKLAERVERLEQTGPAIHRLNNTLRNLDSLPLRLHGA